MEEKKELLSLDKGELEALFAELGEPRYRAAQLFLQLHRGLSPEEMTNIGKATKAKLSQVSTYHLPLAGRSNTCLSFRTGIALRAW